MNDNAEPVDVKAESVVSERERDLALPPATRYLSAEDVADIEQQIKLLARVRRAAIAMTTPSQWFDFGGNPYMEGDAGLTLAHAFGLDIEEPKFEWEDLGQGHVRCLCTQTVVRNGRRFWDVGDSHSFAEFLDPLVQRLERAGATADQIKVIVRGHIQKAARQNALSRVVSGWTGLRGLSWDDLAELGLTPEKAGGRMKFRKGTAGGKVQQVSVSDLKGLADGSKVRLVAQVLGGVQKQTAQKDAYCNVSVTDGEATVELRYWAAKPDWLIQGVWAVGEVVVGTYRNRPQYAVSHFEEVPAPTGEANGSRAAEAIGPRPDPASPSAGTGGEPGGDNPDAPHGQLGF